MLLVERIKELCNEKGITFIGLEREIGLSRGSIRRWVTNLPSIDKLQKVADYFRVSTDYLLGRTNHRNNFKSPEDIENLEFYTPEEAMKFILEQPVVFNYGGLDLNQMNDEEIMALADDMLFAMKISIERMKKNKK